MGLAVKYASRIKRLSLAQRLDDVIQQQLEEEEEEDDDDRDIDDQEGGFRTLTVGNRAGQAGNRILNTERQSEEAVTPGSFQAIQLLRQQERKTKQAQAVATPHSCSESEEEEDRRDNNVASPVSKRPIQLSGTRNGAAANPFKRVATFFVCLVCLYFHTSVPLS
jgi:hypothetical protein